MGSPGLGRAGSYWHGIPQECSCRKAMSFSCTYVCVCVCQVLYSPTQEALILLDLIGSSNPIPSFHDMYTETTNLFQRLVGIGT